MSAFDAYVQAAYHGDVMAGGPTFTVVHDAETPLKVGYADSIAEFFRRGPTAGTSAHAMVGPEKAIKMLPDNVVAWAAGPYANSFGWHLEQTGYASFTPAQWLTPDGVAQLNRVGACLREVHDTWKIPKRWMTDSQLRAAAMGDRSQGGMTTHQQVARVLGGTTHTDPEDNYPRDPLLRAVLSIQGDDDMARGDEIADVLWEGSPATPQEETVYQRLRRVEGVLYRGLPKNVQSGDDTPLDETVYQRLKRVEGKLDQLITALTSK